MNRLIIRTNHETLVEGLIIHGHDKKVDQNLKNKNNICSYYKKRHIKFECHKLKNQINKVATNKKGS